MDRIRRSRQRVHRADNNASADGARFGDRRRECGCAQYARGVSAHVQSMQGVKIEECSLAWHGGPFPTEVIRFERLGPSPADAARCDNRSPVKEPLGSSQGGSTSICLWALLDLRLSRLFSHVQEGACRKVVLQRLRREKRRGDRALAVVEARFSDDSLIRSVCLDDS